MQKNNQSGLTNSELWVKISFRVFLFFYLSSPNLTVILTIVKLKIIKMRPEIYMAIASLILYVIGIILSRTKPKIANIIKYIALGLLVISVILNFVMKK